jgi:hypothetical protein
MDTETSNVIVIYSDRAPSIINLSQISVGWLLETGRDPVGNQGGGSWGFLAAILK